MSYSQISVLVGKTLTSVVKGSDAIAFHVDNGDAYEMRHDQDCCESVYIEDICGDLQDLVGSPITLADEVTNSNDPPAEGADDSYTWTFYHLATAFGYVTIRWFGTSNGYYSESVSFHKIN
jgi:hypothetical protein